MVCGLQLYHKEVECEDVPLGLIGGCRRDFNTVVGAYYPTEKLGSVSAVLADYMNCAAVTNCRPILAGYEICHFIVVRNGIPQQGFYILKVAELIAQVAAHFC